MRVCARVCVYVHVCVRVQPLQSLLRPLHPSPLLDPLHLPRSGWTRPFPGSAGRGPAAVLCPGRPLAAAGLSPRASPMPRCSLYFLWSRGGHCAGRVAFSGSSPHLGALRSVGSSFCYKCCPWLLVLLSSCPRGGSGEIPTYAIAGDFLRIPLFVCVLRNII